MIHPADGVLTMCKRAGRMIAGFDVVKEACVQGKLSCICVASDLSEKSLKEILFICNKNPVPVLELSSTMDELWHLLGRRAGILGITDAGFAAKLTTILNKKL